MCPWLTPQTYTSQLVLMSSAVSSRRDSSAGCVKMAASTRSSPRASIHARMNRHDQLMRCATTCIAGTSRSGCR